jgi:hypothetical protein
VKTKTSYNPSIHRLCWSPLSPQPEHLYFSSAYCPEEWGLLKLQHRHFKMGNEKMNIALAAIALNVHFPVLEPIQPLFL